MSQKPRVSLDARIVPTNQDIESISRSLLDILFEDCGVYSLLDKMARLFGIPLMFSDIVGKVYAHAEPYEISDPVWNEILRAEHLRNVYISSDVFNDVFKKVGAQSRPYIYDTKIEGSHRIAIQCLRNKGHVTGYCLGLEGDLPFSDLDMDKMIMAANAICQEQRKDIKLTLINGNLDESLICDFLANARQNLRNYQSRMAYTGWRPGNNFYLLITNVFNDPNHTAMTDLYRSCFQDISPMWRTAVFEQNLVVLMDFKSVSQAEEGIERATRILEQNGLVGGLSPYFLDINELSFRYRQSVKALQLGDLMHKGGCLISYYDLYFYDLLSSLDKNCDVNQFFRPEAKLLMDYDAEFNTELYKTCYYYLKSGKNMLRTAARLQIHKNTIAYRISKIKEITHLDLDDGEDCYELYLSFKIRDMYICCKKGWQNNPC